VPFIRERVRKYLLCNSFDPDQVFDLAVTRRERRRARGGLVLPPIWATAELHEWISKPESTVLQLPASLRRIDESKDFALDMIQLLKSAGLPVIWHLFTPNDPAEDGGEAPPR
jgi:hypothetical protein